MVPILNGQTEYLMVLKLKSEFPSTSLWYDTYSAQESLETKAMVCHGQVGGEGQLSLSQTVFFFIFSIKVLSLLSYLIAFFSYSFPFFLCRSPMVKWAVKNNWVYLRLFASLCNLCNPLCAVVEK